VIWRNHVRVLHTRSSGLIVCIALFFIAEAALAVAPSLSQIIPRGGKRGATLDYTLSGGNLSDAVDLLFYDPGVTMNSLTVTNTNEVKCNLTIAPDAEPGLHAFRVRTKSGVSNLCLMSVGNLNEIDETEPNNALNAAQAITPNTTINGMITSEDVDYFSIDLAASQRLAVEVEALRFGTTLFDPKLRLLSPNGNEIVTEDDTILMRQDAAFVYTAKDAGKYTVVISETSFGGDGNCRYRLHIGSFPRPLSVTPLGGAPGAQVEVKWLGDPALDKQPIVVPASTLGTRAIAAQVADGLSPTPVPFRVSNLAGALEVEPNNDAATASPMPAQADPAAPFAGCAFDGVIEAPGDVDWFKFAGKKDQAFEVRLWARALGSRLDSVMTVTDVNGSGIVGDDDAAVVDSLVRVTLPADGEYKILVADHLRQGGPTYAYRIEVTPITPKLTLGLIENDPISLTVPQGNQALLLVSATREDFDAPLQISAENLPAGITLAPGPLNAGQTVTPVIFTAAPDAQPAGSLARLIGTTTGDGPKVEGDLGKDFVFIFIDNLVPFYTRKLDRLAIALAEPAPYSVEIVQPKALLVHSGSINLKIVAKRAEGFTAPIDLRMPWMPPGMAAGTAQIPEGQTETALYVAADGGAAVATHQLVAEATSSGFKVCTPFVPVEVSPPFVTFNVAAVETEQGKPIELVAQVAQNKPFEGTFQANLLSLPKGVTTAPQDFTSQTTEVKFPLTVAPDAPAGKFDGLFVQTVIQNQGEGMVHNSGSGKLAVYVPLPPTLAAPAPAPEQQAAQPAPEQPRQTRFPKT
jgi:hypothetical protein